MFRELIRALGALSDWRLWGALVVTAVGLAAVQANQYWSPPGGHGRAILKLAIYWGLWLVWPAIALVLLRAIGQLRRGRLPGFLVSLAMLAGLGGLAWARFIEPNQLKVVETSLSTRCGVRVALVSDLHTGLYVSTSQIENMVRALNAQDVDAVLIAGDFTYEPLHDLRAALAPLAGLRHKAYFVLGNHDEASPGPVLRDPLLKVLADMRLELIEGRRLALGRCELVGLGDLHSNHRMRNDLEALELQKPLKTAADRVVLTHDPDAQVYLPGGFTSLLLAAHTHGGQMDLPWLTDRMLARFGEGGFKAGLYDRPNMRVFVTSGIGMVKLPMRFHVPPRIEVLAL